MTFLANLLGPVRPVAVNPFDDRYYDNVASAGLVSSAGTLVSPETALKIAAVWACNRVISDPLGAVPLQLFRYLADGGRQRARGMPLYDVLHSTPNSWQTSLEWRKQQTTHALMRGNGFSRILEGPRGPVDRLVPILPSRLRAVEQSSDYRLRYKFAQPDGSTLTLLQDEVMHLRGLTLDGLVGVSVIEYAAETMGLSMAAEGYAARAFSQSGTPAAALVHKGPLSRTARRRLRDEWEADTAGLANAHRTAVLAEGMDVKVLSLSNKDSQLLEAREFQVEDVARWFGVPLHMIQSTTKETSWGSGIEQLWLGFITGTLLFWARAWEQTIERDLILDPTQFYAEFNLDALARGTLYERYQAYHIAVTDGILDVDEVREMENRNRRTGPAQLPGGPATPPQLPGAQAEAFEAAAERQARQSVELRYRRLATAVAERVVRKEQAAMERAAKRCQGDPQAWSQALGEFYGDHQFYVSEALHVDEQTAARYVEEQRSALLAAGPEAMRDWPARRAAELVRLACLEAGL